MRTLNFIVDGQTIRPDPDCDFSGLIPGTEHFLRAKFTFSQEWRNCTKVAAFWSRLGNEFPPCLLKDGASCTIPAEALESKYFKIQVIGKRSGNYKIVTNKFEICQNGG